MGEKKTLQTPLFLNLQGPDSELFENGFYTEILKTGNTNLKKPTFARQLILRQLATMEIMERPQQSETRSVVSPPVAILADEPADQGAVKRKRGRPKKVKESE